MSPRRLAGACMLGAYLICMGFLGGTIYSAIKFDQRRAAVLAQFEESSTRLRAKLMHFEHQAERTAVTR